MKLLRRKHAFTAALTPLHQLILECNFSPEEFDCLEHLLGNLVKLSAQVDPFHQ